MCGIVGILARGSEVPEELLERATQSLAHRGPDDHGTVILRESVPEQIEVGSADALDRVISHAVEAAPKTSGPQVVVDTQVEAQAG